MLENDRNQTYLIEKEVKKGFGHFKVIAKNTSAYGKTCVPVPVRNTTHTAWKMGSLPYSKAHLCAIQHTQTCWATTD